MLGIELLSGLDAGTTQPVAFTFYDSEFEPAVAYTHFDGFLDGDVTWIDIPLSGESNALSVVKVESNDPSWKIAVFRVHGPNDVATIQTTPHAYFEEASNVYLRINGMDDEEEEQKKGWRK